MLPGGDTKARENLNLGHLSQANLYPNHPSHLALVGDIAFTLSPHYASTKVSQGVGWGEG